MLLSFCRSSFITQKQATYVSAFILDDVSTDGLALIEEIRLIYDNYGYERKFAASKPSHNAYCEWCQQDDG
jgi:transaldolase